MLDRLETRRKCKENGGEILQRVEMAELWRYSKAFLTAARVFLTTRLTIWAEMDRNPCILTTTQKHEADSAQSQKILIKRGEKGLLKGVTTRGKR